MLACGSIDPRLNPDKPSTKHEYSLPARGTVLMGRFMSSSSWHDPGTQSTCLSVWGEPSPGTNICLNRDRRDSGEFVPDGSYPHIQTKQWECWKVTCTRDSQETLIREYTVNLPTPHAWVPADIRPLFDPWPGSKYVANNVRDVCCDVDGGVV